MFNITLHSFPPSKTAGERITIDGDTVDDAANFLSAIDPDSMTLHLDSDSANDGKFL